MLPCSSPGMEVEVVVVVEVVEVVEVVVAVAAAARTGARDERVSKLGGEGRVQPDRRRLCVQNRIPLRRPHVLPMAPCS